MRITSVVILPRSFSGPLFGGLECAFARLAFVVPRGAAGRCGLHLVRPALRAEQDVIPDGFVLRSHLDLLCKLVSAEITLPRFDRQSPSRSHSAAFAVVAVAARANEFSDHHLPSRLVSVPALWLRSGVIFDDDG